MLLKRTRLKEKDFGGGKVLFSFVSSSLVLFTWMKNVFPIIYLCPLPKATMQYKHLKIFCVTGEVIYKNKKVNCYEIIDSDVASPNIQYFDFYWFLKHLREFDQFSVLKIIITFLYTRNSVKTCLIEDQWPQFYYLYEIQLKPSHNQNENKFLLNFPETRKA